MRPIYRGPTGGDNRPLLVEGFWGFGSLGFCRVKERNLECEWRLENLTLIIYGDSLFLRDGASATLGAVLILLRRPASVASASPHRILASPIKAPDIPGGRPQDRNF